MFKEGDRVICVNNPNGIVDTDNEGRGSGWKLGLIFTIKSISDNSDHTRNILWDGYNHCGVYDDYVKYLKWKDRYESKNV